MITEKTMTLYTVEIDGKPVEFIEQSRWEGMVKMTHPTHGSIIAMRKVHSIFPALDELFGGGAKPSEFHPIAASIGLHKWLEKQAVTQ